MRSVRRVEYCPRVRGRLHGERSRAIDGMARHDARDGGMDDPENRRPVMAFSARVPNRRHRRVRGRGMVIRFGWRTVFFVPRCSRRRRRRRALLLKPGPAPPDGEKKRIPPPVTRAARGGSSRPAVTDFVELRNELFAIKLIRYSLLFWLPYYLSDELSYKKASRDTCRWRSSSAAWSGSSWSATPRIAFGACRVRLLLRRSRGPRVRLAALHAARAARPRSERARAPLIGALLFGPDSVLSGAAAQDPGGPSRRRPRPDS